MTAGARGWMLVALLALAGCPNSPFTTCDAEPDLTGQWQLDLMPDGDTPIPRSDTILADLQQKPKGPASLIWGTLTSDDKGFFDVLQIPQLTDNNGSKTGAKFV